MTSAEANPTLNTEAFWLPVWTLSKRELIRFFRQRTRIIGALGQPVIFWILFGSGMRSSFQPPDWGPQELSYQEYFYPGVAVMIVLFTAIFSTISIIEDRREGFLQGVLVAPVSRLSIVLGKIFGGAALAVIQTVFFLAIGPFLHFVGLSPPLDVGFTVTSAIGTFLFVVLLSVTLTALGYVIAWPSASTQGYHAIMSVFLFPMWLLSGAFFPPADSGWLKWVMAANPLTYGMAGLRYVMYPGRLTGGMGAMPSFGVSLGVTVLFCVVCVGLSVWLTTRRSSRDAR